MHLPRIRLWFVILGARQVVRVHGAWQESKADMEVKQACWILQGFRSRGGSFAFDLQASSGDVSMHARRLFVTRVISPHSAPGTCSSNRPRHTLRSTDRSATAPPQPQAHTPFRIRRLPLWGPLLGSSAWCAFLRSFLLLRFALPV